jgi:NADP-dependent 3-hydroxy acid dehydrogenase YdfG
MTLAFTPQEEAEAREVEQILRDRVPTSKVQMVAVDLRTESACKKLIEQHLTHFGTLDTL